METDLRLFIVIQNEKTNILRYRVLEIMAVRERLPKHFHVLFPSGACSS
jgi:hypothetical protein